LSGSLNDLLSSLLGALHLSLERLWNVLSCLLDDTLHPSFQIGTLLIHLLHDLQSFQDDIKVSLLLQSFLCHGKDCLNLLLVLANILKQSELLVERFQARVEIFGLFSNDIWVLIAIAADRRVQLVDIFVCIGEAIVKVLDRVDWILGTNDLFTIVKLTLHTLVSLLRLRLQVLLETFHLLRRLIQLQNQLDFVIDIAKAIAAAIGCGICREKLLDGLLELLLTRIGSGWGTALQSGFLRVGFRKDIFQVDV